MDTDKKIIDVCCPPEMGCLGEYCPNLNVPRHYCDKCGGEIPGEELKVLNDGTELCGDCYEELTD